MKKITTLLLLILLITPFAQVHALARGPITFGESRQRIEQIKDKYNKSRGVIIQDTRHLKAQRKELRDLSEAERGEHLERRRQFLNNAIERMSRYIESISSKTLESEKIDEETRNAIIENLDIFSDDLASLQSKAVEAETNDDIKNVAQDARELWQTVRLEIRIAHERYLAARINNYLDRVENQINDIEEGSIDTQEALRLISSGRDDYDQAVIKINSASTDDEAYKVLINAHADLRRAHLRIKEAINN